MDGLTLANGLTTFYDKEAEIDRLMLSHSATRIIAADSSKLGRTVFAKICDINEVDYIVSNQDNSAREEIAQLQSVVQEIITV